jgi:hypothetical protein
LWVSQREPGNKIEYVGDDAIRFMQTLLLQSYSNKVKLGKKCFNTPVIPRTVLKKPAEVGKVLGGKYQTILRSGIGKVMHHIQYLHPNIAQAVRRSGETHGTRGCDTHSSDAEMHAVFDVHQRCRTVVEANQKMGWDRQVSVQDKRKVRL